MHHWCTCLVDYFAYLSYVDTVDGKSSAATEIYVYIYETPWKMRYCPNCPTLTGTGCPSINSTCPLTILFSSVQGIFSGAMLAIYVYIAYHIPANSIYCNVSNSANEDFHTWSLLFSVRRSLFTLHQGFFKESLQCLAVQKDTDQPKKTHPQTHWPMISAWPMFFRLSQNATKVGLIFCFGKKVRHVRSPHVIGLVDFF